MTRGVTIGIGLLEPVPSVTQCPERSGSGSDLLGVGHAEQGPTNYRLEPSRRFSSQEQKHRCLIGFQLMPVTAFFSVGLHT